MIRLREPFSAAKHNWVRRGYFTGLTLAGVIFGFTLYVTTRDGMLPSALAGPAAAYVSLSSAVTWIFISYCLTAQYRERTGWHRAMGCLAGSSFGVMTLGFARETWRLPVPAAGVLAAGSAIWAARFIMRWSARKTQQSLAWLPRQPATQATAQEAYQASQYALTVRGLSPEERKSALLSRARAAIARSVSDDAPDGLVEAADDLRELLADPPESWRTLFGVAVNLVDARSTRAAKHGDLAEYDDALRILADTASRMPADLGAMAVVYQKRAEYQGVLASRLAPGPAADERLAEAAACLRAAISAISPSLRPLLPTMHADLGVTLARLRADPGDLEAGIAECRLAVRLARRSRQALAYPRLSLAVLLLDRIDQAADQAADLPELLRRPLWEASRADLAQAGHLLRQVRWYGPADSSREARQLLPDLELARAIVLGEPKADQRIAQSWRISVRATAHDDPMTRVLAGQGWVSWAETTENPLWCAEAYAYLMSAAPAAVAVRYDPEERDRVLATWQSAAEEAGYWLAEAGQLGEAAIALEAGRAVSLSEILGRERPGLEAALLQAGRPDLAERYRLALAEYQGAKGTQRAWARYETVVREIADVTGLAPPGAEPTLADLRTAASEGPVVYLASATRGGYAIIIWATGDPVCLKLPPLTRAEIPARLSSLTDTADSASVAAVLSWLWNAGIDRLSRELPPGALVTIIPVGLLSLLPVHAAGGPAAPGQPPGDWTYLADKVTVRYAPNARTLLRAEARASALEPEALSLLAVAAPDGIPGRRLWFSSREVARISELWPPPARVTTIGDGDHGAVMRQLAGHTVWHFACHCRVYPERILDSALLLDGAELSLRTVLELAPAPRRLAILSACETHRSGSQLPDEAMGLPTGLLQAGFAGVVASHWAVGDISTAILMTRFHELWRQQCLPPAEALARAQRWLRSFTYADLRAYRRAGQHASPPDGETGSTSEQCPFSHPFYWAPFALTGR